MPGRGKQRRRAARQRMRREKRMNKRAMRTGRDISPGAARVRAQRMPAMRAAMEAATAVPRAGLDIVTDAAQRTKQLLTPKG